MPINYKFHLNMRKNCFMFRVEEHWSGLPREVIEAPSLDIFKIQLDKFPCRPCLGTWFGLGHLKWLLSTLMILGFCDFHKENIACLNGAGMQTWFCFDINRSFAIQVQQTSEEIQMSIIYLNNSRIILSYGHQGKVWYLDDFSIVDVQNYYLQIFCEPRDFQDGIIQQVS